MDELHTRLLRVGFRAGDDLGLVLAGGYALAAHDLVSRPSRDIDFAVCGRRTSGRASPTARPARLASPKTTGTPTSTASDRARFLVDHEVDGGHGPICRRQPHDHTRPEVGRPGGA
ncbi:nucleotidyl transferase AbiEii/AbiGii toxin family protein [Micromonospora sp. WMMB235]|uniref:nucleotidyl transferase AbiEii/AbiGii toxin family protein n=1 Tax=Micromonospora sp. WMMB235 TaxID=1172030 RepID=UPI0015A017AA